VLVSVAKFPNAVNEGISGKQWVYRSRGQMVLSYSLGILIIKLHRMTRRDGCSRSRGRIAEKA
jgi:hypothetical protein